MIIKFQIIKSFVVEAVKSATYLKSKVDEAADPKATKIAYQETAGDDPVHENALTRDFDTALEVLKTIFVDYLVPTPTTIGDNAIYYTPGGDDLIEFTLSVSRRYNGTLTDTLARLSARYLEDYMIYQWWIKTNNLKQAEPYQSALVADEQTIRKCFVMSGPVIPTVPYSKTLAVKVNGEEVNGGISITLGGGDMKISYTIDPRTIDDIEARSDNPDILGVERSSEKYCFTLKPLAEGTAHITLFSRHSDELKKEVEVTITNE